jgi:dTDP-4-amino-4,6-dideoxy-D-galactose acyltransferase
MMDVAAYIDHQKEILPYYSPYHCIRSANPLLHREWVMNQISRYPFNEHQQYIPVEAAGELHLFLVRHLSWDTQFFGRPVYRLITVLYRHRQPEVLSQAAGLFIRQWLTVTNQYCFIEIPSEDTPLMQALTASGFKLIETRLMYYHELDRYDNTRFSVRHAAAEDAQTLRTVAASVRNPYDRFHAEPAFGQELADAFLGQYAEAAVNGYCDAVLVPDEAGVPAEAFVAIDLLKDAEAFLGPVARVTLAAVAPSCQGWHYKLVSEAMHYGRSAGASYLLMVTQSTNRPVIRNSEKLGFSLGAVRHILSYSVQ